MRMMCSNLTKTHTFPIAIRACSKPSCFKSFSTSKPQSLQLVSYPKPSLNPAIPLSARPICFSMHQSLVKLGSLAKPKSMLSGYNLRSTIRSVSLVRAVNFSSSTSQRVSECRGVARGEIALPWLPLGKAKEVKGLDKAKAGTGRSSWEVSADRLEKVSGAGTSVEESGERLDKAISSPSREEKARKFSGENGRFRAEDRGNRNGMNASRNITNRNRVSMEENRGRESRNRVSAWEERGSRNRRTSTVEDGGYRNRRISTVEDSGYRNRKISTVEDSGYSNRTSTAEDRGNRSRMLPVEKDWRRDHIDRGESTEEESVEVEEMEVGDDPRWDKIKNRFGRAGDVKGRHDGQKPELRRWNKQEDWGKRTFKEATESTLPLMIGEGVYGVGPVLAALSAERREFYALYVQEGLDLSSNNRKKKDKKGFENVLRIAEKKGLSIQNISKHDLNMIADNRPHQGLVLDASPLEMVKIKELDPVSVEDKGSLWVALDEVTDPQNLGAIIRSSYFFGASGVVLCAKNSAPLSGVVSKASAGSLELMELRYCKNMMQFLTSSAENGWRVLGGSVSPNSVAVSEVLPGAPTILVLGNEGTGLRPLVERSCTQLIKIPGNIPVDITAVREPEHEESTDMDQRCSSEEFRSFMAVESLNVSVATGVLLHYFIGNKSTQAEC